MSWNFSAALAAEYLGTCFADTALCARLNSIRTAEQFSCGDRTTETSQFSRFGMTSEHLTDDDGEALLTWYREDFLATIFRLPETVLESSAKNHPCGFRCSESFGKYDRNTSLWKTPPNLFGTDSTLSSADWTKAGTMRNGMCWARPTLAHRTIENDAGFSDATGKQNKRRMIPTPRAQDALNRTNPCQYRRAGVPLAAWVCMFPTPTANGMCGGTGGFRKLKELMGKGVITPKERRGMAQGNGGKLNPRWTEWLMAFPIGWSGLEPLAMPKSRSALQPHGTFCMSESTNNDKEQDHE